jgi:uncharacterized protein YecT (DUF1311 family)
MTGCDERQRGSPLRSLFVAIAALLLQIATCAAAPSFDCKAANAVERICDSDKLSALDRDIANVYKAALARLADDPQAVTALREDQRHFITLRDKGLTTNPDDAAALMETQRNFLRSIVPRARGVLLGLWENVGGVAIVAKTPRGRFKVDVETFGDPLWGNRYCLGGGDDFAAKGAWIVSANGATEWNQRLTRRGHRLIVEEIEPRDRAAREEKPAPDYCGANGSLAGTFFPVRGPKPSYGDTILVDPPE